MNNQNYTGVPIWSEHVSETQMPIYQESIYTDIESIDCMNFYESINKKHKLLNDDKLERIIGG